MRRARLVVAALVLSNGEVGCTTGQSKSPASLLAEARRELGPSPKARVCRTLRQVMLTSEELYWPAAREYARCLARRGMLSAGRQELPFVARRLGPGRMAYLAAFLHFASGPAGFEAGRRALLRAHRLLPKAWEPAYRLGLLALSQDDLSGAKRWLDAARRRGGGAQVLVALARLLVQQGRLVEACRVLGQAARGSFSARTGWRAMQLSELLARLGALSSPSALARFRKAQERLGRDLPSLVVENLGAVEDLNDANLLVALGKAHLRLGNDARAAAALQQALNSNSYAFDAALLLGRLKLDAGRTSEAAALFQEAVSVAPFSPEARRALAEAWAKSGTWGQAAEAYRVAYLMQPTRRTLLDWVGALRHSGAARRAAQVLSKWLDQHEGDADGWGLLGDVFASLYRRGRDEQAERDYERAVAAYRRALHIRQGDIVAMARLRALGAAVKLR